MNQELVLWIGGILAALVGGVCLLLLRRVLSLLDDTNSKVTIAGVSVARIETTVTSLAGRVDSLDGWRSRVQERAVEAAEQRAENAERRNRSELRGET